MIAPQTVQAQLAGGAMAGGGQLIPDNTPFNDRGGAPEPSQCIRRAVDNRRSASSDDNQLTAWVSVHRPVVASILTNGSANGPNMGSFSISVLLNDIPIAHSQEARGPSIVSAESSMNVHLLPGRQYKITAKATPSRTKRLDLFNLYVGVGKPCS